MIMIVLFSDILLPSASKVGSVVAGQTSVKAPEKEAFEKYLPEDVHIVSCHSLHGPTVSPLGQPLVSDRLVWRGIFGETDETGDNSQFKLTTDGGVGYYQASRFG